MSLKSWFVRKNNVMISMAIIKQCILLQMLLPDCVSYIIFVFLAMWHGAHLLNRLSRVLFEQNWRPLYSNYIEKIEIKHMLSNFYASFILRYRMNFQILQRTEIGFSVRSMFFPLGLPTEISSSGSATRCCMPRGLPTGIIIPWCSHSQGL